MNVVVAGEVHQPGSYALGESGSISSILTEAGGITEMASDTVYVERLDETGEATRYAVNLRDPRAQETRLLRSGDKLIVTRAPDYSIAGEVKKPGIYRLDASLTVGEAISKAGGVTVWAESRHKFEIRRRAADGAEITVKAAPEDFVEPGDLIRVKGTL